MIVNTVYCSIHSFVLILFTQVATCGSRLHKLIGLEQQSVFTHGPGSRSEVRYQQSGFPLLGGSGRELPAL